MDGVRIRSKLDSEHGTIINCAQDIPDLRSEILNAILELSAELESRCVD